MSKKELRIIIGSLEVGGAEIHLSQVLPQLAERGWQIELVVLTNKLALAKKFNHPHIKIYYPTYTPYQKLPSFLKRFIRLGYVGYFLIKILSKNPKMITHFFLPEAYIMGL